MAVAVGFLRGVEEKGRKGCGLSAAIIFEEFCRWRSARTAVHFLFGDKKGTKKAPFDGNRRPAVRRLEFDPSLQLSVSRSSASLQSETE
ncbi:hypothetical protein [uncultured Pseudodesulfovibrio sp.]|uniref:hypothetical protein n=1 Tax=uncultured Pseudodesulfovibrio sp. TaxID=2035858 RepID=UPI0029C7E0F5|nr:hypothetical protein [uncultured Pseudodesulfovibrio sp.]